MFRGMAFVGLIFMLFVGSLSAKSEACIFQRGSFVDHWPHPVNIDCTKTIVCEQEHLPYSGSELEMLLSLSRGGNCVAINDFAKGHRAALSCEAIAKLKKNGDGLDLRYLIWFAFTECDSNAPAAIWKSVRQVTLPEDPSDYAFAARQMDESFKRGHPGRERLANAISAYVAEHLSGARCKDLDPLLDLQWVSMAFGLAPNEALSRMKKPECISQDDWNSDFFQTAAITK